MASTFRTAFQIERTFNWFPGHMARGLRDMTAKLQTVDLIIETRDARLPLSSINPQFEEFAQERNRLIVYNKTDLTTPGTPARIRQALAGVTNAPVVFTNAKTPRTVRSVVSYAAELAGRNPSHNPSLTAMVVGMPNVGKSALINALRSAGVGRGNAVTTGRRPGVTQRIHTSVKIHANPPVYVLDTPGLMLPYVSDPLRALKVALTDGMNTEAMEIEIVADYLLYQLNRQHNTDYAKLINLEEPSDNISEVLAQVAKRFGILQKGGGYHHEEAARRFVREFQLGKFGHLVLDDLDPASVETFMADLKEPVLSKSMQLKEAKRERAQKMREKNAARKLKLRSG